MRKRIILGSLVGFACLAIALVYAQAPKAPKVKEKEKNPEELAIRNAELAYGSAYNKGDLDTIMTLWAADADFVDEDGKTYKGRDAIRALFKAAMDDAKGSTMKLTSKSLRFLKPDVAIEDGMVEITSPEGIKDQNRFTAIWMKTGGKWQLTNVRDLPDEIVEVPHAAHMKGLEWMIGDWANDDKDVKVTISCRWALDKKYIRQEFSAKPKDGKTIAVVQYIGWDPVNEQVRSWFFDSHGGFGEGSWEQRGKSWTASSSGVLPDGRQATGTHTWRYLDAKSFMWIAKDREVDGDPLDDIQAKLVRVQTKK